MSAFENTDSISSVVPSTASVLPTVGRILCCLCGVSIIPNAVAMCSNCMQQQPEFLAYPNEMNQEITQCPKCDRWSVGLHSDYVWAAHELESQGLLAACMKKVHAIQNQHDIKILDAAWIWTEPHSKRLKFYMDTERLIFEQRQPIRQRVVCTYVVKNSQCKDCIIKNSDHTWSAQLQVRQARGKEHTQNIEQLLIQHKLGALMNDVKLVRDGIDLYFDSKQSLEKVQSVLQRSLPCIIRSTAKRLISRDSHTSTARTEHVVVLEVVPLLKHDLVLVTRPHISGKAVGIIRRVTSTVQVSLLTQGGSKAGLTSHHVSLTADKLFKNPVPVLIPAGSRYLSRFIVLDVNVLTSYTNDDAETSVYSTASQKTLSSGRLSRAEVEVMSEDDTDVQYRCETDIGHVLQPGDTVLAYDTQRLLSSLQDSALDASSTAELSLATSDGRDVIPEVVLVSKVFDDDSKAKDGSRRKHVSGGGGQKKRNRIPPWRRAKEAASAVEPIAEGDEEDDGEEDDGGDMEEGEGEDDVWEDADSEDGGADGADGAAEEA